MLQQLIELTNSEEYLDEQVALHITQVTSTSEWVGFYEQISLKLLVELEWRPEGDAPPKQLWKIECHEVMESGYLQHYVGARSSIRVYDEHPVLFYFQYATTSLLLKGPRTAALSLLGALYLAHEKACGHWLYFHTSVHALVEQVRLNGETIILINSALVEAYQAAAQQQGFDCQVLEAYKGAPRQDLQVLIWDNSASFPSLLKWYQPYVVAKHFDAVRIA